MKGTGVLLLLLIPWLNVADTQSSNFDSIHNKLVDVARFANGLAISESLAQGKISFGKIVTDLLIAGEIPFELDRIQLLADSSQAGIDKIISQLASFESFVEGKTKFNASDSLIKEVSDSLKYGFEVLKMKRHSDTLQKVMDKFRKETDSLKQVSNLILDSKLNVSIEAASVLGKMPEFIESYTRLKSVNSFANDLTVGYGIFESMKTMKQTDDLLGNFENFVITAHQLLNESVVYGYLSTPASKLEEVIMKISNADSLKSLNEYVIKDCSNVILLLASSLNSIGHLETLDKNFASIEKFEKALKEMPDKKKQSDKIEIIEYLSPSVISISSEQLNVISEFMKKMEPISDITEWAKSVLSSARTKRSTSDEHGYKEKFLNQLKHFAAFNGTQSFINCANLSSSEAIDKKEIIDLIDFEKKISQQLESVNIWLGHIKYASIVDSAVKSIQSMIKQMKNFKKMKKHQEDLNKITGDVNKLASIHQAKGGYAKLIEMLKWLKSIPNWKKNIREIMGKDSEYVERERGLILGQISEVLSFFKQFMKIMNIADQKEKMSKAARIPNLDIILQSAKNLFKYYRDENLYAALINNVVDQNKIDIAAALNTNIAWNKVPKMKTATDEDNEKIRDSLKTINGYKTSLDTLERNEKTLKEINNVLKVLKGLYEAAEAMDVKVMASFGNGLSAMKNYSLTLPSSPLTPTNLSILIFSTQSNPSVIESLTKNIRVLFNLMQGLDSIDNIEKLQRKLRLEKNLPDPAKNFINSYQEWFDESENMKILSPYETEMTSMELLEDIGKIMKKISKFHNWLKSVPQDSKSRRIKRSISDLRKSLAGSPYEDKLKKLINLVEKAQDPKTSYAVKQLGKDLETLAASFGVKIGETTAEQTMHIKQVETVPSNPSARETFQEQSSTNSTNEAECSEESDGFVVQYVIFGVVILLLSLGMCSLFGLTLLWFKNSESAESERSEILNEHYELLDRYDFENGQDVENEEGPFLLDKIFPGYRESRNVFKLFLCWDGREKEPHSKPACKRCSQKTPCSLVFFNNLSSNRYVERTACYEGNRIYLEGKPTYVNAQEIFMPDDHKFIAAQGPLEHTINHFFKLIYQEKVKVICMLGDYKELGVEQSAEYMKNKAGGLYAVGTPKTIESKIEGVEHSKFKIKKKKGGKEVSLHHLHLKSWERDDDVPTHFKSLPAMLKKAKSIAGDSPILVHCTDGTGRTMIFIGMEYVYQIHTTECSFTDKMTHVSFLNDMKSGCLLKKSQMYMMYYGMLQLIVLNNRATQDELKGLTNQFETAMKMYREKEGIKKVEKVEGSAKSAKKSGEVVTPEKETSKKSGEKAVKNSRSGSKSKESVGSNSPGGNNLKSKEIAVKNSDGGKKEKSKTSAEKGAKKNESKEKPKKESGSKIVKKV